VEVALTQAIGFDHKYEVVFTSPTFATRDEARTAVFHYIETYYNRVRLHSSLG
jgi:putative transposase